MSAKYLACALVLLSGCKKGFSESLPNLLGQTKSVTAELDIPPATVMLGAFAKSTDTLTSARCTGIVVSPDLVLTAAHCVASPINENEPPALIKVQAQSLGRPGLAGSKVVDVAQWKRHPNYSKSGPPDIALLRLSATLDPYVKPIALAPAASLGINTKLLLAGYGATETDEKGGTLLSGWAEVQSLDPRAEFTIRRPEGGASPYYGDSGGPAFLGRQGLWFAAGLVSRGSASGRVIYTDLSSPDMLNWVLSTARELGAQPPVQNGLTGMGSKSVMGESTPAPTPNACGSCRKTELEACISSGRKDCYPSLGCIDFSASCNQSALRICLDSAGGNACYPKWGCASSCSMSAP